MDWIGVLGIRCARIRLGDWEGCNMVQCGVVLGGFPYFICGMRCDILFNIHSYQNKTYLRGKEGRGRGNRILDLGSSMLVWIHE